AAAFLPFNAPRARVFLGDVGSYGLGAGLALLLILAATRIPAWAAILVPSVYLADVLATLFRRARAGKRLTEAHREHVYQRLAVVVASHGRVSLFVTGCSALAAAAAVGAGLTASPGMRALCLVAVAAVVTGYLATPWMHARVISAGEA
ncbi:MAG: UDP-GlcNAc:undecaprenyl-phosphate/decaprenyl-phosphate GlcNAc-phosphate transferase, partial [Acidimicrobiia bacterium]|nr:UDP-GlcNAc:undecaprenyl-phosphate/decaprenyl-phosphate GlcNAc-phosphate transferase [Acidimicrobiia bacterium]